MIMKISQTHFKNIAVWTAQDFQPIYDGGVGKKVPLQIFSCDFYKRRNEPWKHFLDL